MVRTAEQTARSAELSDSNKPGFCLQWSRERAAIDAGWPTAAQALQHVENLHADRHAPRGAFVFWTGGSRGFGHIAISLGGGMIRSTDAGGLGVVATRELDWFDEHWTSLQHAGWSDNVNGQTVPGVEDDMQEADFARIEESTRKIVKEEIAANNGALSKTTVDKLLTRDVPVTMPDGSKEKRTVQQLLRETWQRITKGVTE